jgi:hypothetical protein
MCSLSLMQAEEMKLIFDIIKYRSRLNTHSDKNDYTKLEQAEDVKDSKLEGIEGN